MQNNSLLGGNADTILILDWVIPARIGVLPHEKTAPQRIRLNLRLILAADFRVGRDDITDTVCYDRVRRTIAAHALAQHTELVETLADAFAKLCLHEPGVAAIELRLEKLDIYDDGSTVGVEITRRAATAIHSG